MYIKKLQVYNYKSYLDSGEMRFEPGVNIIVGKNNAGKTSLLEVLTLDFEDQPHRSLKTLPTSSSKITEESHAEISLLFDKEELVNLINQLPHPIGLTFPNNTEEWWDCLEPDEAKQLLVKWFQKLLDNPHIELILSLHKKSQINGENNIIIKNYNFCEYNSSPKCKNAKCKNGKFDFVQIEYNSKIEKFDASYQYGYQNEYSDIEEFIDFKIFEGNIEQTIGYQIFNIFKKRIYRFEAERLNIGSYKLKNITNFELKSDASNLAEVISILQGKNPGLFSKYNGLVSEIFEEIKWISVVPRDNLNVEIIVWTIDPKDPKLNRDDLSFPLSSCRSGVSQVLAIVYILVCFDREGKTITQLEDLERSGFNFLERPMYENYILHSEAISAMINEEREKTLAEIGVENADSKWLKSPITSAQVQECFDKIQQEKQYLLKGIENDNWFFKVHGADVIQSVFQELCENQLDFNGNKPKYCLQITELIIKHQPDFLFELAEELKECLNKNK
jgi:hypothetical protein